MQQFPQKLLMKCKEQTESKYTAQNHIIRKRGNLQRYVWILWNISIFSLFSGKLNFLFIQEPAQKNRLSFWMSDWFGENNVALLTTECTYIAYIMCLHTYIWIIQLNCCFHRGIIMCLQVHISPSLTFRPDHCELSTWIGVSAQREKLGEDGIEYFLCNQTCKSSFEYHYPDQPT